MRLEGMFSRRFPAALAVLGACAAFAAAPATAARPGLAPAYPELLTTPHFQIHYTGAGPLPPGPPTPNPERIVHQTASDLGALAEQAYATIVTGWGYPAPLDDGDGKIDVWVQDLAAGTLGSATADGVGNTSTGWIAIDVAYATSQQVIAHELFHLVQFAVWIPADAWLLEGTAEWAGFAADGYKPLSGTLADTLAAPDMSLDCVTDACGDDGYETGGYSRWSFFEYMSERFGATFVKDVFARGATLADPAQTGVSLLASTLESKGKTLGDVFTDYTSAHVAGGYEVTGLKGVPPATYATIPTGTVTGALPIQRVSVNHLAARYLKLTRAGSDTGLCHSATLALTVALPAGIGARPSFYSSSLGGGAVPLTINGTTASLSVPWNTCSASPYGYLSLPNPTLTSDAQVFTVSGSLTVDTSTVVTTSSPPAALFTGTTVASPTTSVAPSIFVYGAQIVRVSAADRMVRLIVFSSGPGLLRAAVGQTDLGTDQLRAGNNDVRFRLPPSAVAALRTALRIRAAGSVLTLTSLSTQGAAGTKLARKLVVITPPKRARTSALRPS